MANCEKLGMCPFFANRMAKMPATASIMKKDFCCGDRSKCARFQVSSRGIPVPEDLYPNQTARAQSIIANHT
jgi:hypothetical protein